MKITGLKILPVALIAGMIGVAGAYADNGTYVDDGQNEIEQWPKMEYMIDSAELYQPGMQMMQQWADKFKADAEDMEKLADMMNRGIDLLADIGGNVHQFQEDMHGRLEYLKADFIRALESLEIANLTEQELKDLAETYRKMMPRLMSELRNEDCFLGKSEHTWLRYPRESGSATCQGWMENRYRHDSGHRGEHISGHREEQMRLLEYSRHLELENLARPVYSEIQVVNFAVDAVTTALNMDFENLKRHMAYSSGHFRHPDGWDSFLAFVDNNGIADSIRDEKLISSAIANGAIVMDRDIDSEGRYNWIVRVSLKVEFESPSSLWKEDMLIEVVVSREKFPVEHWSHSMNVAIAGFELVNGP